MAIPGTPLAQSLRPWGAGAALAACVLNGVWLGCIIFLQGLGNVVAQVQSHPGIFRLSVGSALTLTVLQVPILLAWAAMAFRRDPARALVGGALYGLYIPLNMIAYFLYGRLAPLVHTPPLSSEASASTLSTIIEIGHPLGLTGNLPLLGYGLLGLAWCLLASALWGQSRLWRVAAGFLLVSGILSALGAVGSFLAMAWLEICCFLGGIVSFPALALLGLALWLPEGRPSAQTPSAGRSSP